MLTTSDNARLVADVDKALIDMEQLLPSAASNTGAVALRYWLWNRVDGFVKAKCRAIDKEALSAGVLFDHKDNPQAPGTDLEFYRDDHVSIRVEVRTATTRLNINRLKLLLVQSGCISATALDELIDEATTTNAPPHFFRSSLVDDDAPTVKTPADTIY